MKRLFNTALLVFGMLFCGTINTVFFKLMFQIDCPTLSSGYHNSGYHTFDKPWFTNMMMFVAEASLLGLYFQTQRQDRKLIPDGSKQASRGPPSYYFLLPACCDVLGTGISSCAMMYIDAAVWQMMRGSIIIFTAGFSILILNRKLQAYHWMGVLTTALGLCCVGIASVKSAADKSAGAPKEGPHVQFGVFLVVIAQIFSAFQCTFEEHLLTGLQVSSSQTVGMEGVWGVLIMVVILSVMTYIPGSDNGSYESMPDGLHMMIGSRFLQGVSFFYMISVCSYNYIGMQLCRKLSAVTRCLVDCLRTAVVWAIELGLYYFVSPRYGNGWNQYSWLQMLGFFLLFLGTLIYNDIVKVPCLDKSVRDFGHRALQATWSPTVNRAAAWGKGANGPSSPGVSPDASPAQWPFGSRSNSPTSQQVPLLEGEPLQQCESLKLDGLDIQEVETGKRLLESPGSSAAA